jgi:AAA+ ATPase superfamily predicted ATPase
VKELKEIEEIIKSNKFELVIIYGRRRIGKTELILNATKDHKRIYYLATEENNLERFYNVCLNKFPEVSKLKMDYEVIFEFLKNKTDIIIIDEFQNMIKENKNIIGLFQSIVDSILKGTKIKLFLLGSSISLITSKILSYKSPLYGRRTGSLNLKKISFFSLPEFFPKMDIKQLIEIYGFADGIPYYLIKIDNEFWGWFKKELEKERSFLRDEVDFLMKYEFEDSSTYKLILQAIAYGNTKINEIKNFIKVKRTDITPYLKNLIDVNFVKRIVPITENIKSRKGRYYIGDNFLKFWFRYIYPNLSSLEEGIFDIENIKKDYPSYLGYVFEDICKEFLVNINQFKFTKIGKWWHKDKEIDIVALNEKTREITFVECKWQNKVNAKKILTELKEKAGYVDWNKNDRKEYYCIFAKSFKEKIEDKDLLLFDLKNLEGIFN